MTTTHTISIPPKFWDDHRRRCVEREVLATKKGKRVVVELTGDEICDLHSDAIYYNDPSDLCLEWSEALSLCMSARATRKAIETQVPNLAQLRAEWQANLKAGRQA